ncbi:4-hydroxy-3-methylbut-2-enyl diphosphate reductase [Spirochaetia bacterium]|nr:4-hydroxy-3-methylbut-2-enyl diphosphate reductase [Spirochaetia bacterium]
MLGCCMGVSRALDLAEDACRKHAGLRLFTLGALIHNKRVLKALEKRGWTIIDENEKPKSLDNSIVIIRAHGISPGTQKKLEQSGAVIIDATCKKVKASQLKAQELSKKGFEIFIAGEEKHAEVRGICGYAPKSMVVRDKKEAETAANRLFMQNPNAAAALIGQTTISKTEFNAIKDEIVRFFPNLSVFNTICKATTERQEALAVLCGEVEAVLIIGDRESANTRRLLAIASEKNKPAWLVESACDIPPEIFSYRSVGISAGASTPDEFITEITGCLEKS